MSGIQKIDESQLSEYEKEIARRAAQVKIRMAYSVSKVAEETQAGWIERVAIAYGYFTAGNTNCKYLLDESKNKPDFEFFKK